MSIILFIIVLALLILVHEMGHFFVAKLGKVRVDEFGLGLPPRVWGYKYGETLYSLNWLPFGGFVKIFGENPNEENINGPDRERSLVHKPRLLQASVLVAGVTLNLVLAWFLISINLTLGMPVGLDGLSVGLKVKNESLAIVNVIKDSPANAAGLQVGDSLISLKSGVHLRENLTPELVKDFVLNQKDEDIVIKYQRAGEQKETIINPQGELLGIAMARIGLVSVPWWQAPVYGLYFTYHLSVNTLSSLGYFAKSLVTDSKAALTAVAGPIGIYALMADAERLGLVYLLNFIAMISINLAILNLLPFPALDGGRLLFVAIEAIIRRPIKPVIANTLNLIGFTLLIILMVVIAGSDIFKLL